MSAIYFEVPGPASKLLKALPLRYTAAEEVYGEREVDDHVRVIIFGQPFSYEWAIQRDGKIEKHSDCGYGNTDIALIDGLTAYWRPETASKSETSTPEDPGMIKLLTNLVDRMYKMHLMAIPSLRVTEQDPDSNDPVVAWMSDVRSVLYRNKPVPDIWRDLK